MEPAVARSPAMRAFKITRIAGQDYQLGDFIIAAGGGMPVHSFMRQPRLRGN